MSDKKTTVQCHAPGCTVTFEIYKTHLARRESPTCSLKCKSALRKSKSEASAAKHEAEVFRKVRRTSKTTMGETKETVHFEHNRALLRKKLAQVTDVTYLVKKDNQYHEFNLKRGEPCPML